MPVELIIALVGVLGGALGSTISAAAAAYVRRRHPETEVRVGPQGRDAPASVFVEGNVTVDEVRTALQSAGMPVEDPTRRGLGTAQGSAADA